MNTDHPAEHGDYKPGHGFYDKGRRGYVSHPTKLSKVIETQPVEVHAGHAASFEAWTKSSQFKANPNLEQLRALRDSDKPEQRAKADRLLTGRLRMELSNYEQQMREHVAGGGTLPEGVTAPGGE